VQLGKDNNLVVFEEHDDAAFILAVFRKVWGLATRMALPIIFICGGAGTLGNAGQPTLLGEA
jgi:hypothetical protein